jgi:hypothetical protein
MAYSHGLRDHDPAAYWAKLTRLTEDQIERRVEKMTDNIDARFLAGHLTQDAYDKEMADLAHWAEARRPAL